MVGNDDAYAQAALAERVESAGVAKAGLATVPTLVLGVLAGAFIALGAVFYAVVMTANGLGFGPGRLLGGLAFSLGLILVIVGGAELFTGNSLIVFAWADRKISARALARNWALVYLGNLAGAREWLRADSPPGDYDWFAVSRVIPDTINEFPGFSFTLGDLHAHVLAIPFTLLALAFALQVALDGPRGDLAWRDGPPGSLVFGRGDLTCAVNVSGEPFPLPPGELVLASDPSIQDSLAPDTAAWLRRGAA